MVTQSPWPGPVRCNRRVSMRTLSRENSFHSLVPSGNCQLSMSLVSMRVPGGSEIQRRLLAPSLHSSNCGR